MPGPCTRKWVDAFVTAERKPDEWVGAVWSVRVDGTTAHVTGGPKEGEPLSAWIMSCRVEELNDVRVGDLVRIGTADSGTGYSDYLTVVEKVEIIDIGNATTQNPIKYLAQSTVILMS